MFVAYVKLLSVCYLRELISFFSVLNLCCSLRHDHLDIPTITDYRFVVAVVGFMFAMWRWRARSPSRFMMNALFYACVDLCTDVVWGEGEDTVCSMFKMPTAKTNLSSFSLSYLCRRQSCKKFVELNEKNSQILNPYCLHMFSIFFSKQNLWYILVILMFFVSICK